MVAAKQVVCYCGSSRCEGADYTALPALIATESGAGGNTVDLKVRKLTVERYRGFRELSINGLARVNLITGKNNTGKSSILEVLRILVHRASPRVIEDILSYREEIGIAEVRALPSFDNLSLIGTLFNGYPFQGPNPSYDVYPVSIRIDGAFSPSSLTMRISDLALGSDQDQEPLIVDHYPSGNPAFIVRLDDDQIEYMLDDFPGHISRKHMWRSLRIPQQALPAKHRRCITVDANAVQQSSQFGELWDNIALSKEEEYVVHALNIIDPRIMTVSMVGGGHDSNRRRAIVRTSEFENPVSLRSFGDGMNRLFGIILSLVNARGGLLLIDEFESGLHHSVHIDAWKMVLKLARDLDVQVFATSHSWDAIKAFEQAASENFIHEAALIKLERIREEIVPTVFVGDELEIIARHEIEVR